MASRASSVIALLVSVGCGGSATQRTTAPDTTPTNVTVAATPQITFTPASASIVAGGTITFAFGAVPHNVYFDAATGAPADITGSNTGTSVSRTFTAAGNYSYRCHIHPGMTGVVAVGSSTGPVPGGGYGY